MANRDKKLSSNIMNMKFMQKNSPAFEQDDVQIPPPADGSGGEGWSLPNAQQLRPKKAYKNVSLGFSELQAVPHGRLQWKHGTCKQVVAEEQPEAPEVAPDVVKKRKKPEKSPKPKSKKPKKKS